MMGLSKRNVRFLAQPQLEIWAITDRSHQAICPFHFHSLGLGLSQSTKPSDHRLTIYHDRPLILDQ